MPCYSIHDVSLSLTSLIVFSTAYPKRRRDRLLDEAELEVHDQERRQPAPDREQQEGQRHGDHVVDHRNDEGGAGVLDRVPPAEQDSDPLTPRWRPSSRRSAVLPGRFP